MFRLMSIVCLTVLFVEVKPLSLDLACGNELVSVIENPTDSACGEYTICLVLSQNLHKADLSMNDIEDIEKPYQEELVRVGVDCDLNFAAVIEKLRAPVSTTTSTAMPTTTNTSTTPTIITSTLTTIPASTVTDSTTQSSPTTISTTTPSTTTISTTTPSTTTISTTTPSTTSISTTTPSTTTISTTTPSTTTISTTTPSTTTISTTTASTTTTTASTTTTTASTTTTTSTPSTSTTYSTVATSTTLKYPSISTSTSVTPTTIRKSTTVPALTTTMGPKITSSPKSTTPKSTTATTDSGIPDCIKDTDNGCAGRSDGDYPACFPVCQKGVYLTCFGGRTAIRDCQFGWYTNPQRQRFLARIMFQPTTKRCEYRTAYCPRQLDAGV